MKKLIKIITVILLFYTVSCSSKYTATRHPKTTTHQWRSNSFDKSAWKHTPNSNRYRDACGW